MLKTDIRILGDWDFPAIVFDEAGSRLGREDIKKSGDQGKTDFLFLIFRYPDSQILIS